MDQEEDQKRLLINLLAKKSDAIWKRLEADRKGLDAERKELEVERARFATTMLEAKDQLKADREAEKSRVDAE